MWVGQHQLSSVWRRFASIISSWFMSSPTFLFFPQKNVMICCCKTIIKKKLFGRGVEIKQLDYVSLTATTFFRLKKFASTISSWFTSTIKSKPRAEKKKTHMGHGYEACGLCPEKCKCIVGFGYKLQVFIWSICDK